jgi:hypothetical protein
VADIFQGAPNPALVSTSTDVTSSPEFYTNYLQDIANLGQAGIQQGGVAGFSPLQAQALSLAPEVAFSGIGSAGTGQEYLTAAGATPATALVNQYMNPYQQNVVNEMARLQQRGITENILPNLRAGAAGTGQFGSQRAAQVTGQTLRDLQSDLLGRQYTALSEGYRGALGAAQADLQRQMQSGQALGQLGQVQQGMGTQGLQTLSTLGAQEQALGQRVLDQPMQQAQQYAKLLQGYAIPTTATKQTVGSQGYSNSPLSQIGGLLALLTSYRGQGDGTTTEDQSTLSKIGQGVNVATGVKKLAGYADGGMVSPDVAYTDVDGNMYDANGTMVG